MDRKCELRAVQGIDVPCEKEKCIFWRVATHDDLGANEAGCGIEQFELQDDKEPELSEWLLCVKKRPTGISQVEDTDCSD